MRTYEEAVNDPRVADRGLPLQLFHR